MLKRHNESAKHIQSYKQQTSAAKKKVKGEGAARTVQTTTERALTVLLLVGYVRFYVSSITRIIVIQDNDVMSISP